MRSAMDAICDKRSKGQRSVIALGYMDEKRCGASGERVEAYNMVGSGFLTHFQCVLGPATGNDKEMEGVIWSTVGTKTPIFILSFDNKWDPSTLLAKLSLLRLCVLLVCLICT